MIVMLGLLLTLAPSNTVHPTANKPAAEVAVTVRGRANEHVRLSATGVPAGWVASFCSPKICAPFRVGLTLPASGVQTLQLSLIRDEPHAVAPHTITVTGSERASASIAFSAVALK